jgi:hypothetical protein
VDGTETVHFVVNPPLVPEPWANVCAEAGRVATSVKRRTALTIGILGVTARILPNGPPGESF